MSNTPEEPSGDDCVNRKTWEDGNWLLMACWYPQMGGYVGRCVVRTTRFDDGDGCFEAFVWHDGEFPFGDGANPARLHHCSPDQFTRFAEEVSELQRKT